MADGTEKKEALYLDDIRKTLSGPEKTHVKIGSSSDNAVEIVDGLKEGDEVFLYRPFQAKSS